MSENAVVPVKGNPNLRVFVLDDTTSNMHTCLGITEERSDILVEVVKNAFETNDKHTESFVEISKAALHANELVYMSFHYGAHVGACRASNEMNLGGLQDLLGKLKGLKGKMDSESEE
jgi:hypothetical protein